MTALQEVKKQYPPKARPTYEALEAEVQKLRLYKRRAREHAKTLQACHERNLRHSTSTPGQLQAVYQLTKARDAYKQSYNALWDIHMKELFKTDWLDVAMGVVWGLAAAVVLVVML